MPLRSGRSPVASERCFLVRVAGLVPSEDLRGPLEELGLTAHQVRTLLVARFSGPAALLSMLRLLRASGLQVLDVRRLSPGEAREAQVLSGSMVSAALAPGQPSFRLTVKVGARPGAHAVLAPYALALAALHRDLRSGAPSDAGFLDVQLLLESRGVRFAGIALDPVVLPRQRTSESRVDIGIVAG